MGFFAGGVAHRCGAPHFLSDFFPCAIPCALSGRVLLYADAW
jgi:hypothetical protein